MNTTRRSLDQPTPAAASDGFRCLVLGASGYVGGRLIPRLLETGAAIRCLSRRPTQLADRPWAEHTEIVDGDLLDEASLDGRFDGVDTVYYLVHSLDTGDGFEARELLAARHTRRAAERAGVRLIVYLGGLGSEGDDLSPHLASRHAVGRELAAGSVPVVELRAAVIIGSGSASFEMLRGLVELLPFMVTPRWVHQTRCQPIGVADVIDRLTAVARREDLAGVWGVGGRDTVTYAELMQVYARAAGLRPRRIVSTPLVSPRVSAWWVDLVTSLPSSLATELVASLQNDVVVDQERALDDELGLTALGAFDATVAAISAVAEFDIPTRWRPRASRHRPSQPKEWDPDWSGGTVFEDSRTATTPAPARDVMSAVRRIGGETGWYGFGPLWRVRGLVDEVFRGPGWNRGRRHPTDLLVGDMIDAFVVERLEPDLVRLRAEMRMPGHGWLEWTVTDLDDGQVQLQQTARFVPRGLAGRAYWLVLVPFHMVIFTQMVRRIAAAAEASWTSNGAPERALTAS